MGKYYSKITTAHKFKWAMLQKEENVGLSQTGKEALWQLYLMTLHQQKMISKHQQDTWVYPTKELTLQK